MGDLHSPTVGMTPSTPRRDAQAAEIAEASGATSASTVTTADTTTRAGASKRSMRHRQVFPTEQELKYLKTLLGFHLRSVLLQVHSLFTFDDPEQFIQRARNALIDIQVEVDAMSVLLHAKPSIRADIAMDILPAFYSERSGAMLPDIVVRALEFAPWVRLTDVRDRPLDTALFTTNEPYVEELYRELKVATEMIVQDLGVFRSVVNTYCEKAKKEEHKRFAASEHLTSSGEMTQVTTVMQPFDDNVV